MINVGWCGTYVWSVRMIGWIIAKYDLNTGRTKMGFTWCRSLFFVLTLGLHSNLHITWPYQFMSFHRVSFEFCSHARLYHTMPFQKGSIRTERWIQDCLRLLRFCCCMMDRGCLQDPPPAIGMCQVENFSIHVTFLVGRIKTEWKGQFHGWNVDIVLLMHEDKFKKKLAVRSVQTWRPQRSKGYLEPLAARVCSNGRSCYMHRGIKPTIRISMRMRNQSTKAPCMNFHICPGFVKVTEFQMIVFGFVKWCQIGVKRCHVSGQGSMPKTTGLNC
jgi:hypothetical protein